MEGLASCQFLPAARHPQNALWLALLYTPAGPQMAPPQPTVLRQEYPGSTCFSTPNPASDLEFTNQNDAPG